MVKYTEWISSIEEKIDQKVEKLLEEGKTKRGCVLAFFSGVYSGVILNFLAYGAVFFVMCIYAIIKNKKIDFVDGE